MVVDLLILPNFMQGNKIILITSLILFLTDCFILHTKSEVGTIGHRTLETTPQHRIRTETYNFHHGKYYYILRSHTVMIFSHIKINLQFAKCKFIYILYQICKYYYDSLVLSKCYTKLHHALRF